jgi:hypothetical protein
MTSSRPTYRLWKQLAQRPGGSRLFSAAAMIRVPYFASIVPHVRWVEPGYAEVTVPKWFYLKNVGLMQHNMMQHNIQRIGWESRAGGGAGVQHRRGAAGAVVH